MNNLAYFILETERSRTTKQIAAIIALYRLMLLYRSHRYIDVSKDT